MIHGVYGLYSKFHANHITPLLAELEKDGLETKEYHYIKLLAIKTYCFWLVERFIVNLLRELKPGDSIIAHSFGGAIVTELLRQLDYYDSNLKLHNIYLFNPCVDREAILTTKNCDNIFIFHDEEDRLLTLSTWVPGNIMGDLGRVGYHSPNLSIHNIPFLSKEESGCLQWNHWRFLEGEELTKSAQFIKDHERKTKKTIR